MERTLFPPTKLHLNKSSASVAITWRNGETSEIAGHVLRQHCACSGCRSRKVVGMQLIGDSGEVSKLALMGSTGVQVVFADGHDRGIFPWAYLQAIAAGRGMDYLNG